MADTGICVQPGLDDRIDILGSAVELARMLGAHEAQGRTDGRDRDRQAVDARDGRMAAELTRRGRLGEFGDCVVEGPLSFDLAYAADAGAKKHVESDVAGAADIMLFPNLLSANLTVKAIMYTADCQFRRRLARNIRAGRLHVPGRFDRNPAELACLDACASSTMNGVTATSVAG